MFPLDVLIVVGSILLLVFLAMDRETSSDWFSTSGFSEDTMKTDGREQIPTHEQTGPHPVVVATRSEGNIVVNTKVLIGLVALLLGGTVGGGGISLATNSKPEHDTSAEVVKMTAEVARLNSNVAETNNKLVSITVTLTEMKGTMESSSREDKKRDEQLADHESRLRRLERPGR